MKTRMRWTALRFIAVPALVGGFLAACPLQPDGRTSVVDSSCGLSGLSASDGHLFPPFLQATLRYTSVVPNSVASLVVNPTKATSGGRVEVRRVPDEWQEVASGAASSPLPLDPGGNTVEVRITAEDGLTVQTYTILVGRLPRAVGIAAGLGHTLVVTANGQAWAWGNNFSGELGDGTTTNSSTPVALGGFSSVAEAAAGGSHTALLKTDGTVWCCGYNYFGAIGDGTTTTRHVPVQVLNLAGILAISAGYNDSISGDHTVAIAEDGRLWAWGCNSHGQLGDGSTSKRLAPVRVREISGVVSITAGWAHTLALDVEGQVWAWGSNYFGQLGDGTTSNRYSPAKVVGLAGTKVTAISTGWYHTVALKSSGAVWAWGSNAIGQLGDGTMTDSPTPVLVCGGATAISAGYNHTLILKTDGTVWAWRSNSHGQLGNGTTANSTTPIQVNGLSDIAAIAANRYLSVARKADGTFWAWGDNSWGQLGDATTNERHTPVQVLFP